MEKAESKRNVWLLVAALPVALIILAGLLWSFDHPYGIFWDEADDINDGLIDCQRLKSGLLIRLGGRFLLGTWGRPPAYRMLALPFVLVFGPHATAMRLVSLACLGLSSAFVYLAARRLVNPAAGAFAVLVFALSPEVVWASSWFSTEGPLYLATSAMLYFMIASWTSTNEHRRDWVGLGLAVGLGFWSKASFLVIAVPALSFWLIATRWLRLQSPSRASQRNAALLSAAIAAPWWLLNIKSLVQASHTARTFVANSLGPLSLATLAKWLYTVFLCLLGPAMSVLILVVLMVWLGKAVKNKTILQPFQWAALGLCACAGCPIVLVQLSGTNHLLRHISPAMIPLAIAFGVMASNSGWAQARAAVAASCALCAAQLLVIIGPVGFPNTESVPFGFVNSALPWRVLSRSDQWDWTPLQRIADECGLAKPKIAYLGLGVGLTPPQLVYPWALRGAGAHGRQIDTPALKWLWRFEEGPVDWQKVMDTVGQSDIVLTLPNYLGQEVPHQLSNLHNTEFAERLSRDPRLQGPIHLKMGRFAPVDVEVFLRKDLVYGNGSERQQDSNTSEVKQTSNKL